MQPSQAQKLSDERRPQIRIWAPDSDIQPAYHDTMQRLAGILTHIETLLARHGIAEADFMPPLARGTYIPDSGVHYEMYSNPDTPFITEALQEVRDCIYDQTELTGDICESLSPAERELLKKEHGLSLVGSANSDAY